MNAPGRWARRLWTHRRRRTLSLRARLTLVATVVATLGLGVGGLVTQTLLERTLLNALDESARSHATDIAALVEADRLTNPLPSSGAAIAQVVDAENRVLASTPGGDQLAPIVTGANMAAARAGEAIEMPGTRLGQTHTFRVVAARADSPDGPHTVIVAVSLAEQRRTADLLKLAAVSVTAGCAVAVGGLTWFITGRTLRPVEELRHGAAEITGTGEGRLLPVPAARDELHRLAVTLNDMLRRLGAASARQRAFVADAAHELRSPLATLRTELEVALAHPDRIDPHETASEALEEVERMARLVDDLLMLARLDERTVEATGTGDLREIADSAARSIPEPRVPVTVETGDPVTVRGDPEALHRMIRNLVDNGVRHASTRVRVAVWPGDDQDGLAELRVSNDGPPVPAGDRERIFERFTRLDDARSRDAGGAGLGLAIVREIARAHGGDVSVENADRDVCFAVRLPRARI
ncbi:HAMP domain-containing protein [Actinobacteria bacterium YIM 96077]|uniref:histidine kinase n=1 Tax=Phytoactinopolyspora halophila TaxID=1981511 RepID=A0A329QJN7_9ACTN|nr:ATP-binding protein [Phytoactinopolyspora halophila]AYY13509.1 HAMP domain-containing protein [Actinobacteria bacterium YIM 96077]RAW12436.1 two-component sensor histidine kinase [Phytoactinopolyspora halophila]